MNYRIAICTVLTLGPALAQANTGELARLINAYRAAPATCNGQRMGPAAPLRQHPALAAIRVRTGEMLGLALEQNNYRAAHVEAISVSGSPDAVTAMNTALYDYCAALRSPRFVHVGIARSGSEWQIVMAEPEAPKKIVQPLPSLDATGPIMLAAVNRARAVARTCGATGYPPAPRLRLNAELNSAALAHSRDMAYHGYFAHIAPNGDGPSQRAQMAGYRSARVSENIALGQRSIDEVMGDWLASPGHCANIMDANVTEMGAAHDSDTSRGRPYWTQVFGNPR